MNNKILALCVCAAITSTACEDWLLEETPGVSKIEDYFSVGGAAIQCVNASYVPLTWQLNNTYFSEWFIGDIVSDDALKGGQNISDMSAAYDLENFKANTNNDLLLEYYRAQYQGVGRCNLALDEIPTMKTDTSLNIELKNRLIGEAYFLRAMYYFRLVRVFGGVPKVDFVIESSGSWHQPRATSQDIYDFIISDLKEANQRLWLKSKYADSDLGRATKGAAQAMLLKAYLYNHQYEQAKAWGDSVIASNEYSLVDKYADNFTLAGENGAESVFEIQYSEEPTSDYGEGNGFTRGNFTVILTRSRASAFGGWGFNKPTQNLYNEFEAGDIRRDETIYAPTSFETSKEEIYLGTSYLNRKYAMMDNDVIYKLTHNSRAPINTKTIRYADVLLMQAEALCEYGSLAPAKELLNKVRNRVGLEPFPYSTYADTQDGLRQAIRHERRVELAMEGHRWFDLCRWGVAKKVMDAYKATETEEARKEMAEFVEGKNELMPIPSKEIDLNPMEQNPGY